jgi:hypothetical protein
VLDERGRRLFAARRVRREHAAARVNHAQVDPVRAGGDDQPQVFREFRGRRLPALFEQRGDRGERLPLRVNPALEGDGRQLGLLPDRVVELRAARLLRAAQGRRAEERERQRHAHGQQQ